MQLGLLVESDEKYGRTGEMLFEEASHDVKDRMERRTSSQKNQESIVWNLPVIPPNSSDPRRAREAGR